MQDKEQCEKIFQLTEMLHQIGQDGKLSARPPPDAAMMEMQF